MPERIDAEIVPTGRTPQEVELRVSKGYERYIFPHITDIGGMLWRGKTGRAFQDIASITLLATAITEASKSIFPFISSQFPDVTLTPLSHYPVLHQLSTLAENPLGIAGLAAIGAVSLGRSALRGRARFAAIHSALHQIRIHPPDHKEPI